MRNFDILQNIITFSLIIIFFKVNVIKALIYSTAQIISLQIKLLFFCFLMSQNIIHKWNSFSFFILLWIKQWPSELGISVWFWNNALHAERFCSATHLRVCTEGYSAWDDWREWLRALRYCGHNLCPKQSVLLLRLMRKRSAMGKDTYPLPASRKARPRTAMVLAGTWPANVGCDGMGVLGCAIRLLPRNGLHIPNQRRAEHSS